MADEVKIEEKELKELLAVTREIQKRVDEQGKTQASYAQLEADCKKLIERQDELEKAIKAKSDERKLSFTLGQMNTDPVMRGIQKAAKIPVNAVSSEGIPLRAEAFTQAMKQPTQDAEMQRFKELTADLYFTWNVMKSCRDFRGDITALDTYRRWKEMADGVFKAINTLDTATEFAAWIPTGMMSSAIEAPLVVGDIEPLFQHVTMPTPIYKWPTDIVAATLVGNYIAEQTGNDPTNTDAFGQTFTGTAITFTADKVRARLQYSFEAAEDSIIAARPNVERKLGLIMRNSMEGILLNGDDTPTHMDTDIEALGANDCRVIAKGLRKYAFAAASPYLKVDLATFSEGNVRAMRTMMLKYSNENEVVFIVSAKQYLKMFNVTNFPSFCNQSVFGMAGFNTTGRFAAIDGISVLRSEHARDDTDLTGINGVSGNTKSVCYLVNKNYFFIGERRLPTLAVDIWNQTEVVNIALFRRLDFQPFATPAATTYPLVTMGYNMA